MSVGSCDVSGNMMSCDVSGNMMSCDVSGGSCDECGIM